MHQLTDEQLAIIIAWAKNTPDVQAVFLHGPSFEATARPVSGLDLVLLIKGEDPFWRLATFLSHRRNWRAELEKDLAVAVQLERARADVTDTGYVELWRRG